MHDNDAAPDTLDLREPSLTIDQEDLATFLIACVYDLFAALHPNDPRYSFDAVEAKCWRFAEHLAAKYECGDPI